MLRGVLVVFVALACSCAVEPTRKRVLSVEQFFAECETLIARHYPAAKLERTKDALRFEYGTRLFLVHESLKTGEWQDASEMRGPDRGGILGNITLEKGPYQGAAEVPQTFDKRYFEMLLMAPDLPALDAHMRVELWYPANVSPDFLKDFRKLVDDLGS